MYHDDNFWFSTSSRNISWFQKLPYTITQLDDSTSKTQPQEIVELCTEPSLNYNWIYQIDKLRKLSTLKIQEVFAELHFNEEDFSNIVEALKNHESELIDLESLEKTIMNYFFNEEDVLKILNAILASAQNDAAYHVSNLQNPASSILLQEILRNSVVSKHFSISLQKTASNAWQWSKETDKPNTFHLAWYIKKMVDNRTTSNTLFSRIEQDSKFLVVGLDADNGMKDVVIKIDGEKSAKECGLQDVIEISPSVGVRESRALFHTNCVSPSLNTQCMNLNSRMQFYCIPGSNEVYVGYLPIS